MSEKLEKEITSEDKWILAQIEEYWRLTIAAEIFHASERLKPTTVDETFEMCEKIARGKENVWGD
jgi:hypothetical protein